MYARRGLSHCHTVLHSSLHGDRTAFGMRNGIRVRGPSGNGNFEDTARSPCRASVRALRDDCEQSTVQMSACTRAPRRLCPDRSQRRRSESSPTGTCYTAGRPSHRPPCSPSGDLARTASGCVTRMTPALIIEAALVPQSPIPFLRPYSQRLT
jgi:hypothetical protein